jgi:CheY-like chemotaxis protein
VKPGASILVADDSSTIRRVVELTLGETGVRVDGAASGAEELSRLATSRPDLVLADVVMPEPSGYELCRRIKTSARPVPVLLLAGTFEAFDPRQAQACGADGYLVKPFESRTLLERVEELLARAARGEALALPEPESAEPAPAPAPPAEPAVAAAPPPPDRSEASRLELSDEALEAVCRRVVQHLARDVVREIARDVVPRIAEAVVRERIRELEADET